MFKKWKEFENCSWELVYSEWKYFQSINNNVLDSFNIQEVIVPVRLEHYASIDNDDSVMLDRILKDGRYSNHIHKAGVSHTLWLLDMYKDKETIALILMGAISGGSYRFFKTLDQLISEKMNDLDIPFWGQPMRNLLGSARYSIYRDFDVLEEKKEISSPKTLIRVRDYLSPFYSACVEFKSKNQFIKFMLEYNP
jgi:hypothetical protein